MPDDPSAISWVRALLGSSGPARTPDVLPPRVPDSRTPAQRRADEPVPLSLIKRLLDAGAGGPQEHPWLDQAFNPAPQPPSRAELAVAEHEAERDRRRAAFMAPEGLGGQAKEYVARNYFRPSGDIEAMRTQLHGMVNPEVAAPEGSSPFEQAMYKLHQAPGRGVAHFAIDQFADATGSPGGAAMNADLPIGEIAKLGGAASGLAAAIPTGAIKLPRGGGTLARSYMRGSTRGLGANHPLTRNAAERVVRLHDLGADLPRQGDWRGLNAPEYVASFGVGRDAEDRARTYLRNFAANTPSTDVPTSAREAAAAHAWRLTNPGKELATTAASPDLLYLPGEAITMAGSKVPNINRAWRGEPLSGLKVDAFGNFMLDELGSLGHPMARNQHPGLINWQHETPLIDLPWDRHAGWGVAEVSPEWKLDEEYKHLKKLMSPWEGLVDKRSFPPKTLAANQGGFTNKDLYDRLSWGLGNTLVEHDRDQAMQQLFGRFWSGAQAQKKLLAGKRPIFDGGLLDIHQDVGLLEPGAMNDPDQIYRALEKKPWGNLGWGPGY